LNKNYNQVCQSSTFEMYQLSCPFVDQNRFAKGPPLDDEQKGSCRKCHAITKAFSAFPCSGRQEDFVSGGKFRVCKSACERLFDSCGLPTHRGGIFTASDFDVDTATFAADYDDAESMCEAMWAPHENSVWATEGITLQVVDDSVDGHEECVALEREVHDLRFDTKNLIFNYELIRSGEGFCATEDPLRNKYRPCEDLQKELEAANEALAGEGGGLRRLAVANGGASIYSLDDLTRAQYIQDGWPWENDDLVWGGIVGGVILMFCICILLCVYCTRKRKYGDSNDEFDDESTVNTEEGNGSGSGSGSGNGSENYSVDEGSVSLRESELPEMNRKAL
jgi:hypothetical protein